MAQLKGNPFTITFGKEPSKIIERSNVIAEIKKNFTDPTPSQQIYLITGVRGSGKSALTAKIMKEFSSMSDWIVVDLLPESDMIRYLGGKLCNVKGMKSIFQKAKISITGFGLSAELSGGNTDYSAESEIDKMLQTITKQNKRLLITIDDIASNASMKKFAHYFQSALMKDYNVFIVMNGVYDNIENLQNQPTLTFLQRAPKLALEPLNKKAVAQLYSEIFDYPAETIKKMACLTEGYPYAVQALGYIVWEKYGSQKNIRLDSIMMQYDYMLADGVYDKLWSDMSEQDHEILRFVAENPEKQTEVSKVISAAGIPKSMASNYKRRLIKKGIIKDIRGYFVFALPRFAEYVIDQYEL